MQPKSMHIFYYFKWQDCDIYLHSVCDSEYTGSDLIISRIIHTHHADITKLNNNKNIRIIAHKTK